MAVYFEPGDLVGQFRIERELGRGGMGIVYRAMDERLGRPVALKVLAPHLSTEPVASARFEREAKAVAGISHPGIAAVYEWGEHHGASFIAFEFVEGQTLSRLLGSEGAMPLADGAPLIAAVARALDAAHGQGVFHRDVKPSNIIVRPSGEPVLVDFGLAFAASLPAVTASASLLGTPAYLAPELIRGDPVEAAADQYSLAVVAYELLTGRVPFDATAPYAVLHKQLNEAPVPPSELAPALPASVDVAILRAMMKSPGERFESCAEFAAALVPVAAPRPSEAPTPSLASAPPLRTGPRGWRRAGIGACAALALAGVGIGAWFAWEDGSSDEPAGADGTNTSQWLVAGGDAANTNQVEDVPLAPLVERWTATLGAEPVTAPVWGDGTIVLALADGTLKVIDTVSQAANEIATGAAVQGGISLAEGSDGLVVYAALDDGRVTAYGLSKRERRWPVSANRLTAAIAGAPAIDPDGQVWVATVDGQLTILDPVTGTAKRTLDESGLGGFTSMPVFSDSLGFVPSARGGLVAIDLAQFSRAWTGTLDTAPSTPATVGDSAVFIGTSSGAVHAFRLTDGAAAWQSAATLAAVTGLATDGERVFASYADGTVRAFAGDGALTWEHPIEPLAAAPIIDGTRLIVITKSGKVCVLLTEDGEELRELRFTLDEPALFGPVPAGGSWYVLGAARLHALAP